MSRPMMMMMGAPRSAAAAPPGEVASVEYFKKLLDGLREAAASAASAREQQVQTRHRRRQERLDKASAAAAAAERASTVDEVRELRKQVAAALREKAPGGDFAPQSIEAYGTRRAALDDELRACEADVARLESAALAEASLNEVESLLSSGSLVAAAAALQQSDRQLFARRRRSLSAALETRLVEAARMTTEIAPSQATGTKGNIVRFKRRCPPSLLADDDDDDDDKAAAQRCCLRTVLGCLASMHSDARLLDELAAALEPVLLQATSIQDVSTPDAHSLSIAASCDDDDDDDDEHSFGEMLETWVGFLKKRLGLDDGVIAALHGRMARFPVDRVARHRTELSGRTFDIAPLSIDDALRDAWQTAAAEALATGRDIVLGDWHNDTLVDFHDLLAAQEAGDPPGPKETTAASHQQQPPQQQLRVSLLAQDLVKHAETLLDDAARPSAAPDAAYRIYRNVRRIFELYRALFPLAHADTVHAMPRMATLLRNDLRFLVKAANRFSTAHCPKIAAKLAAAGPGDSSAAPPAARPVLTFVDQISPLRDLASDLLAQDPDHGVPTTAAALHSLTS